MKSPSWLYSTVLFKTKLIIKKYTFPMPEHLNYLTTSYSKVRFYENFIHNYFPDWNGWLVGLWQDGREGCLCSQKVRTCPQDFGPLPNWSGAYFFKLSKWLCHKWKYYGSRSFKSMSTYYYLSTFYVKGPCYSSNLKTKWSSTSVQKSHNWYSVFEILNPFLCSPVSLNEYVSSTLCCTCEVS